MIEPSLFDPVGEGCRLRDEGAQLAADSVHGHWRVAAEVELERLAAAGRSFTAADLYAVVGEPPGHRNATGGLFIAAARRGLIEAVGYQQSARVEARGRAVRIWIGRRS